MKLPKSRNYVVINDRDELNKAMMEQYSRFIILEEANVINLWNYTKTGWKYNRFVYFGDDGKGIDDTTGYKAYLEFYKFCGKENIEKMKKVLPNINIWESHEQIHYYNMMYANKKINKKIYAFDVNSSFTYGVMMLSDDFKLLKDYMNIIYNKKKEAKNKNTRLKYKNLQNFLIGYFARINDFISLRSEIIKNSNNNIYSKMEEIEENGGVVFISNTDSIITDEIGYYTMIKYVGKDVGQFKIEAIEDKLFYNSSNCYQLGRKLVYSGVRYFARKHTDLFEGISATQSGSLIKTYNIDIEGNDDLCCIKEGSIIVNTYNKIGEKINTYVYKINLGDIDI